MQRSLLAEVDGGLAGPAVHQEEELALSGGALELVLLEHVLQVLDFDFLVVLPVELLERDVGDEVLLLAEQLADHFELLLALRCLAEDVEERLLDGYGDGHSRAFGQGAF